MHVMLPRFREGLQRIREARVCLHLHEMDHALPVPGDQIDLGKARVKIMRQKLMTERLKMEPCFFFGGMPEI